MREPRNPVLLIPLGAFAFAACLGSASAAPADGMIPLNVPGASTAAMPPAGFDALVASDAELANYGLPPRPDAASDAEGYARWAKAMRAMKTRIVPTIRRTNIQHRPNMSAPPPARAAISSEASSTVYSNNWSGYVTTNTLKKFSTTSSFSIITAEYVIPVVNNASCDGGWDYSSQWVGIDGYDSGDVLQAGNEADAYCSGNYFFGISYVAWYEWYPDYEMQIDGLSLTAGDDMYVEVWATNATAGNAFIENLNTGQTASISFSPPSGTKLIGNSAEWIVERPSVGGSLATLPNYTMDYFSSAAAENFKKNVFAPKQTPIDMINAAGTVISAPALIGPNAIVFNYQ